MRQELWVFLGQQRPSDRNSFVLVVLSLSAFGLKFFLLSAPPPPLLRTEPWSHDFGYSIVCVRFFARSLQEAVGVCGDPVLGLLASLALRGPLSASPTCPSSPRRHPSLPCHALLPVAIFSYFSLNNCRKMSRCGLLNLSSSPFSLEFVVVSGR